MRRPLNDVTYNNSLLSFEENGTIPNMIRGMDSNNRETSDAPLWLFVACNDFIDKTNKNFLTKNAEKEK